LHLKMRGAARIQTPLKPVILVLKRKTFPVCPDLEVKIQYLNPDLCQVAYEPLHLEEGKLLFSSFSAPEYEPGELHVLEYDLSLLRCLKQFYK